MLTPVKAVTSNTSRFKCGLQARMLSTWANCRKVAASKVAGRSPFDRTTSTGVRAGWGAGHPGIDEEVEELDGRGAKLHGVREVHQIDEGIDALQVLGPRARKSAPHVLDFDFR